MVATTSCAVSVRPSWNLTPRRILNVQTLPSAFGRQLERELRPEMQIGVGDREIFPALAQQTDAAGIAHGHRIDEARRHGHAYGHRARSAPAAGGARLHAASGAAMPSSAA